MRHKMFKIIAKLSPRLAFLLEYLFYRLVLKYSVPTAQICIVSFPKCGRTWLHFILANYYSQKYNLPIKNNVQQMSKLHKKVPAIVLTHDGKVVNKITKSKKTYANKKVLFLVRDPRDIVLSYYHHCKTRDKIYNGGISEFIRDADFGIEPIVEFIRTWINNQHIPREFLMISYEDMMTDTYSEMDKILNFLGEEQPDQMILEQSIAAGSFKEMQKREKKGDLNFSGLRDKVNNDNALKVRSGKVGASKEELSESDQLYLDQVISSKLPKEFL